MGSRTGLGLQAWGREWQAQTDKQLNQLNVDKMETWGYKTRP